jgi:hypothetical protein
MGNMTDYILSYMGFDAAQEGPHPVVAWFSSM